MLSFHNEEAIKEKYLNRVLAHKKADNIIQGTGWSNGKGCAVGCTLESYDHKRYPIELGLPLWLAYLEDTIFEGLPRKEAINWPSKFLKAIRPGIKEKDFVKFLHSLSVVRQKRSLKLQIRLYEKFKKDYQLEAISAIKLSIRYHENSEAHSARSAAESAAHSARSAESAALSAESAAWSAWSAESAAWSAARSAAYISEANTLLRLLKKL